MNGIRQQILNRFLNIAWWEPSVKKNCLYEGERESALIW